MAVLQVTMDNFEQEVLQCEKKVLLDFWADWCGPCRMLSPIVEEIAEEREDIKVCKINVDSEPELAMKYQVMSIPTLLVMDAGEVITQSVGMKPKAAILEMIK